MVDTVLFQNPGKAIDKAVFICQFQALTNSPSKRIKVLTKAKSSQVNLQTFQNAAGVFIVFFCNSFCV
jgi:hypothetical protein